MSKLPNFPSLASIKDPAIRLVLQAIIDHLRIRSGEVGDGQQKFLTAEEVQLLITRSK